MVRKGLPLSLLVCLALSRSVAGPSGQAVQSLATPEVFSVGPPPAKPPKPRDLNPKDITDLRISVSRPLPGARLVPGSSVTISVIATDKKGVRFSTADRTLDMKNARITATHMTFDPQTYSLTADGDRTTVGSSLYTVNVEYGQPNKNPVRASLSLRPDFAAVHGPDPDDVQSLRVEYFGLPDQKMLEPGKPVRVQVTVFDREGRQYSTGGGDLPLPLTRLEFKGELVEWSGSLAFTPSADRSATAGNRYRPTVAYRGRPDTTATREFGIDISAIDGPEPADVRSLDVTIEGFDAVKSIVPGSRGRFNVSVTDASGRRYALRGAAFTLPASRLKVMPENLVADAATGTLDTSGDPQKMVNKEYGLSVTYENREDLTKRLTFEPDFVGLLKPYMFSGSEFVFAGENGQPGDAGMDGSGGAYGRSTSTQCASGDDGGPGRAGQPGRNGRLGGRGPRIKVVATSAMSLDGETPLVVFEITATGREPQYFVRPLDSKPIQIIAAGGNGGAGGRGGAGGSGGKGGSGFNTGGGGTGGDGADGGMGGQGGHGGDITLFTSSPELAGSFDLISKPGLGGPGGMAGRAGSGGEAGGGVLNAIASGLMASTCGSPRLGNYGARGQEGIHGEAGVEGNPGQTTVTSGGEALTLARKIANIPGLAAALLFPEKGGGGSQ